MDPIEVMKAERDTLLRSCRDMLDATKLDGGRALTDAEQTTFDTRMNQIDELDTKIECAIKL